MSDPMTSVPPTQPPAAPETDVSATPLLDEMESASREMSLRADLDAALERVRVVEGERDHEREHNRYLQTELDADAKHAALKPGESCDVCTHLESEQVQEWMARDIDLADEALARAESAEAAHRALQAAVEALADQPVGYDYGAPFVYCDDLRALLAGGEER